MTSHSTDADHTASARTSVNSTAGRLASVLRWSAVGVGVYLIARAVVRELTKFDLKGKVVLITGGSRGFGLVLARHLGRRGAKIAICARTADDLELARQELESSGIQVITMTADVTNYDEVKALIRDVIRDYGGIDVLINNAGIIQVGPQHLMTIEDYRLAMQTNFWAQLYTMLTVIPHFQAKGGGRIVNITSIGGKVAVPHLLPYSASKFAAVGLSEGMHAELRKHNIIVTTVIPNLMRTGSPLHAEIKGEYAKEYAWFKHASSNPLLSQDPDVTAQRVIEAIEYGEAEVTVSLTGKLASAVKALAPGWVGLVMGVANRLLPAGATGNSSSLPGWQAESSLSHGPISDLTDQAAVQNNEM